MITTQLTGPYVIQKLYERDRWRRNYCHRCWTASDVGSTVLSSIRSPGPSLPPVALGTMGYGLGAAIGAKMGCPDKTVVNIAGDGCFRMNMNEIATATRYNMPLVSRLCINNHVLGMVRQWQTLFYGQTIFPDYSG